jgi:hypothetical protein
MIDILVILGLAATGYSKWSCTINESLDPTTEGRVKFSLAGSGTKKDAPVSHLAGEAAPKPFSSTPPST